MSDSTTSPAAVEADARNGQPDPLVEKEATGLMNAIAPGVWQLPGRRDSACTPTQP